MLVGSAQNRRVQSGGPFVLQDTISSVIAPLNTAAHTVASVGGKAKLLFRPRSYILKENADLRKRVRDLTLENSRLREAAFQNVSLRKALNLKETTQLNLTSGEVVARNESCWFDTATINLGSNSGVQKGAAVLNHLGLIGQVLDVSPFTSHIVSLTDPSSAVGGMVQRSRSMGIVQGRGDSYLALNYLPKDADIKVGDIIVSSSAGQVIPAGVPIGRVTEVVRNSMAGTTSAFIIPSVHFDQVEQIFVAKVGQEVAK